MGLSRAIRLAGRTATAALAVAAAGCSTVTPFGSINTAATGGQNYLVGRGTQTFPASDGFLEVARQALETDLNVRGVAQKREGDATLFEGKDPKGHHAMIWIRPVEDGAKMHVSARFGTFGDEALSRAYLDRLATRVRALPGEAKPDLGEKSPELKLHPDAAASPGSLFQRRLDEGVTERPLP